MYNLKVFSYEADHDASPLEGMML